MPTDFVAATSNSIEPPRDFRWMHPEDCIGALNAEVSDFHPCLCGLGAIAMWK